MKQSVVPQVTGTTVSCEIEFWNQSFSKVCIPFIKDKLYDLRGQKADL